ncbi:hypothetical protein PRIPAC_90996 [Pristionchus pacificus]|uniref:Uncharacterized protein n=1 Tax=Pristionchus pacificus TaxID=54126 RepID=A0A2A6CTX9_PRIPA|nr:hypothetical protein PRIPAC_90996 [Pristionchus pacificus]|eukprot:PDM81507.1 hypothetical protein PRIPAC_35383 [Pristionchus pacificus]
MVVRSFSISPMFSLRILFFALVIHANNETYLNHRMDVLICVMEVWGMQSEVFSEAIQKVKARRSEMLDWQIEILEQAETRYREKRLLVTTSETSTTSLPTTTTVDWTKSCNGQNLSAELQRRCIEHDLQSALDASEFEDDLSERMDQLTEKMEIWDTLANDFSNVINKVKGSCCQGKDDDHRRAALNNVDREYRDQYNKKHHIVVTTTKATTTTTQKRGPPQSKMHIDASRCSENGYEVCFYDRYCAVNGKASEKKIDMQPYANETVDTSKCPFVSIRRNPRQEDERYAVFQSPFDSVVIRVVWNERTMEFFPEGDEIRCRPFCVVARSHQTFLKNENSGLFYKQATIVLLKMQTVVTRRPNSKAVPTQKPKSEKISIGSIILYSALGLLGFNATLAEELRAFAKISSRAKTYPNAKMSPVAPIEAPEVTGATLARASAECTPLEVSTPNAPTPEDQEARSERHSKRDRSVMKSLLTSPSVSRAHSLHTQLTQSTSEHQEVDSSYFNGKIKQLECELDVWGISREDFSEVIEQTKNSQDLKDWQIEIFDEANKRYRERHLITTEPSITSITTATVSAKTDNTTSASDSKIDTTTSSNTTISSTMEPITTMNTTTASIVETSTSSYTTPTSTEKPTTIAGTTIKSATTALPPASSKTKVEVVPKALLEETDESIPREPVAEPEAKETGVGKIFLFSALGILVMIAVAIGAIAMYHRRSKRRAARIRLKIKGPVRSATSLLTSPSAADATLSVPRAHSSAGASERVCEIEKGRRKSSPSHTQITQSISASQDSPQ